MPQVMGPLDGASDWTFIDLGCGQGMMLQPMRDALIEGKPLFRRVVGVELDPGTHREDVRAHRDPAIEVRSGLKNTGLHLSQVRSAELVPCWSSCG